MDLNFFLNMNFNLETEISENCKFSEEIHLQASTKIAESPRAGAEVKSKCGQNMKLISNSGSDHLLNFNHNSSKNLTSFKCEFCNRSFCLYSDYLIHLKIHSSVKRYPCNQCGKTFLHSKGLQQHNLIFHNTKGKFSCNHCDKRFPYKSHLEIHMRFHTGEKPFACKVCNKSFRHSCNLTDHMHIHTGEKPYLCKVCNKSFTRSPHLTVHMRTHTGEKPFSCNVCNKRFSRSSYVKEHMRIHTEEKPFSLPNVTRVLNAPLS